MAEGKINRHNHPIMVNARRKSYHAGMADGYKDGYRAGYEARCDELHRYYRTIIAALETKLDTANEAVRILRSEVNKNG
jgi:flagellar biosynthesis/type III secretory pathway protein FliH